jgi:hypothetical protein
MTSALKMKNLLTACAFALALSLMSSIALAGDAFSNAGAGWNAYGNGTADATAGYRGDGQGYARTDTRTGRVNVAQGISWGLDEHGISFSASHAAASRFLPAAAGNLNIAIGFDGSVGTSGGLSFANGPVNRYANAGGSALTNHNGSTAGATAGGRSDSLGYVQAKTFAKSQQKSAWRR